MDLTLSLHLSVILLAILLLSLHNILPHVNLHINSFYLKTNHSSYRTQSSTSNFNRLLDKWIWRERLFKLVILWLVDLHLQGELVLHRCLHLDLLQASLDGSPPVDPLVSRLDIPDGLMDDIPDLGVRLLSDGCHSPGGRD